MKEIKEEGIKDEMKVVTKKGRVGRMQERTINERKWGKYRME